MRTIATKEATAPLLYYPCIYDNRSSHIIKQVTQRAMPKDQCERYLKRYYLSLWRHCEAIPQLATNTSLIPSWTK